MKKLLMAVVAAFLMAAQAGAICTQETSGLLLKLPNYGDRGDVWARCVRDSLDIINDAALSTSTAANYVLKSTPVITGGLMASSWANFTSSVTASAFYGDGSTLSGIIQSSATGTYALSTTGNAATATTATTATNNVLKAGDFMTGQLTTTSSMTANGLMLNNAANPAITFRGNNANNGGEMYFKEYDDTSSEWSWKLWHGVANDGRLFLYRRGADNYTYSQTWLQNGDVGIGSIYAPKNKLHVEGGLYVLSSATADAGFYGDLTGNAATASALAADPSDCTLPNVALGINASGAAQCSQPSNVTGTAANITGNLAASQIAAGALGSGVIASSVAVGAVQDASIVGVSGSKVSGNISGNISGNAGTATTLATARTINGMSFDGSADINIATTSYLADGVSLALTGATFSAKSSSVTLQGNTFNGASQLVKLDALSKLPAVDGSQLTNLPSTSGGAVLASTQTFTGANTFTSTVTVGNRVMSSALNYSAVIKGGWSVVGSTVINGGLFTFTNFNPNYRHRITAYGTNATDNWGYYLLFNGDTGTNYAYLGGVICQGGGLTPFGTPNETGIRSCAAAGNLCAEGSTANNNMYMASYELSVDTARHIVLAIIDGQFAQNTGTSIETNLCTNNAGGSYTGATTISTLGIGPTLGAFVNTSVVVMALVP